MLSWKIDKNVFHIFFNRSVNVLSTSINGTGIDNIEEIQNITVPKDFKITVEEFLQSYKSNALLFLTAVNINSTVHLSGKLAEVFLTCGYSNATTPMKKNGRVGTVNIFINTFSEISIAGAINLVMVATEAKALAFINSNIKDEDGNIATGTGTDAIAIFPVSEKGEKYTGMHTDLGKDVAALVYSACMNSISKSE
ncbi:MAG: adenosylcobinamide amidohydrolase [Thermoplasmata archaeon]